MTTILTSPLPMDEAEHWERELAERIEAHLATLHLPNPEQVYLTARNEVDAACQDQWTRVRRVYNEGMITKVSLLATHMHLSKQSTLGLLYTFGYGMPGASAIIEQLAKMRVAIYDIRYSPRSRVHKWRKPYLKNWLGDTYVHLPALGNIHYNDDLPIELADPTTGVPQIAQPLLAGKHGALMCVCKKHNECHRRNASEEILKWAPDVILVPLPYLES